MRVIVCPLGWQAWKEIWDTPDKEPPELQDFDAARDQHGRRVPDEGTLEDFEA